MVLVAESLTVGVDGRDGKGCRVQRVDAFPGRAARVCLFAEKPQPRAVVAGAAHSRDFAVADEALAYLAPAKLMAATVIDLLAGGAAKGRSVLADAPRRTRDEYSALWRDILAQPGEG